MYADVGRAQPVGQPEQGADEPPKRVVGRAILQDLDMAKALVELKQHIHGLTFRILYFRIEELPMRLQRHTIGIPNHWMWLLRRIARSVACYHKCH